MVMFSACRSNNKVLQTSRKNHGGTILCPVTSRMFPFTAARVLYSTNVSLWTLMWMNALMLLTQQSYEPHVENMLWCLWMRFWERKTKNEWVVWWKGTGVVKERTALFLLAPIIKTSLCSIDSLIDRGLWEISSWTLLSSWKSWKT